MALDIIDADETLRLLERAVAERGEGWVYPQDRIDEDEICRYKDDDGSPLCIVGQVASYVGAEVLAGLKEGAAAERQLIIQRYFTWPAVQVLNEAQLMQDRGERWGVALSAARAVAEEGR